MRDNFSLNPNVQMTFWTQGTQYIMSQHNTEIWKEHAAQSTGGREKSLSRFSK